MSETDRTVVPLAESQDRVGWGGGSFELPLRIGRYWLTERIASGGTAVVYKGRLDGPAGFARTVAIKRLYPQFARDTEFVARFAAEARLAARIHHANVVQTFDFVETHGELFLVLEFVEGCTLSALLSRARKAAEPLPVPVATGILLGALQGLSAAHELRDPDGHLVQLVHRDFSPQNVLVGIDGVARVLDFGIAKVATLTQNRQKALIAGKLAYMSPEQTAGGDIDQRSDLFSAGIVLWEALAGRRLFGGNGLDDRAVLHNVRELSIQPPSEFNPSVSPELDALVLTALQRAPSQRWQTARQFAAALQSANAIAQHAEISEYLKQYATGIQNSVRRNADDAAQRTPVASLKTRPNADEIGGATLAPKSVELAPPQDPSGDTKHWTSFAKRRVKSRDWTQVGLIVSLACIGIALLTRDHLRKPTTYLVAAAPIASIKPVSPPPPEAPVAMKKAPEGERAPLDIDPSPGVPPARSKLISPPKPRLHVKKPASAAPAAPNCAVPTFVDAEGISHFKSECL